MTSANLDDKMPSMSKHYISPTMLSTLRSLLDGPKAINRRTAFACHKYGWLTPMGDKGHFGLSESGRRYITEYVERTGDGPEDLKAMFRF